MPTAWSRTSSPGSRIKWLFVIARNSSFAYKGRAIDVKQVGRELGVRYVLEGSVRKLADACASSAQLVDTATGAHVWAERYDRKSRRLFALQDEIALSVVGAIEPSLRQAEVDASNANGRIASTPMISFCRLSRTSIRECRHQRKRFRSSNAPWRWNRLMHLAHAFAADVPSFDLSAGRTARGGSERSIRHAGDAIMYGQDDALALDLCRLFHRHGRTRSRRCFYRVGAALAISPSLALTYILGSVVLAWSGEGERASEWAEKGLRLSPFDPWRSTAFSA